MGMIEAQPGFPALVNTFHVLMISNNATAQMTSSHVVLSCESVVVKLSCITAAPRE